LLIFHISIKQGFRPVTIEI